MGFEEWGILAEHDVTDRTRTGTAAVSFRQQTTSAQAFYALREWLVASPVGERLFVTRPFEERLAAGKFEKSRSRRSTEYEGSAAAPIRAARVILGGPQAQALPAYAMVSGLSVT